MKGIPTIAWILGAVVLAMVLVPLLTGKNALSINLAGGSVPGTGALGNPIVA